jgi:hypothetical protein
MVSNLGVLSAADVDQWLPIVAATPTHKVVVQHFKLPSVGTNLRVEQLLELSLKTRAEVTSTR